MLRTLELDTIVMLQMWSGSRIIKLSILKGLRFGLYFVSFYILRMNTDAALRLHKLRFELTRASARDTRLSRRKIPIIYSPREFLSVAVHGLPTSERYFLFRDTLSFFFFFSKRHFDRVPGPRKNKISPSSWSILHSSSHRELTRFFFS